MRWMAMAAGVAILAGAGLRMEAQQARAKVSRQASADDGDDGRRRLHRKTSHCCLTHLQDGCGGQAEVCYRSAQLDNANLSALKEYGCTGGDDGQLQARRRNAECEGAELSGCERGLRRLFVLSAEWLAESGHRHRRDLGQQPRSLLEGQHGRGRDLLARRSHVGGGDCANWQGSARPRRETGRCRHRFWPACRRIRWTSRRRITRKARQAMRGRAACCRPELVGFDRGAEAVTANYSLHFRAGDADPDRLSNAADGGSAGKEDSRLHQGGQRGATGLAEAAGGFRPGFAGGAAQRAAGGAGERRCNPRREPQAAGAGALRSRPDRMPQTRTTRS